jgi:SAM-dependent methyltransferase
MSIDQERLEMFMGKMVTDLGAGVNGVLVVLGDRLGLYKAIAQSGRVTSDSLAESTETHERYVREWLAAQAASGYLEYDAQEGEFFMTPEQEAVFADEDSPVYLPGGFYSLAAVFADEPKITEAFRTGAGMAWGEHNNCLFCGTAKFFKPSYRANLVSSWIPALDGVQEKLERGAKVADVGCGYGISTMIMAETYPKSQFFGYDFHEKSIEYAQTLADEAGLDNVKYEVATSKTYPGNGYDMVTYFDCLHDMGDPAGACAHTLNSLNSDGTMMIVEPFAYDSLEENLNPVGRVYYGFSTMVCTPSSLGQEVGLGLGACAGEKRLREVVTSGGFTRFRRATETPFNLILEARP